MSRMCAVLLVFLVWVAPLCLCSGLKKLRKPTLVPSPAPTVTPEPTSTYRPSSVPSISGQPTKEQTPCVPQWAHCSLTHKCFVVPISSLHLFWPFLLLFSIITFSLVSLTCQGSLPSRQPLLCPSELSASLYPSFFRLDVPFWGCL